MPGPIRSSRPAARQDLRFDAWRLHQPAREKPVEDQLKRILGEVRRIRRAAQQAIGDLYSDSEEGDAHCEHALREIERHSHEIEGHARKVGKASGHSVTVERGARNHVKIPLDRIPWIDAHIHREGDRLLAPVAIGGAFHHLEAWEITRQADDEAFLVFEPHTEEVTRLHEAFGMEGKIETVTIGGRDYAVFMEPYST